MRAAKQQESELLASYLKWLTWRRLVLLAVLALLIYLGSRQVWTRYWVPTSHLHDAQHALECRDFQGARRHLAFCLEAWPDDAAIHFLAARAARRAGDLDDAEEQLAHCLRLQEEKPDANPGDTALEVALLEAQRGNLTDVEEHLRERLREDHPDSLLILEVLTWQLMWTNRLEEARHYLDQWLQRRPHDYDALVRRGWVAEHLMDSPAALRTYGEALEVDPVQDSVRLRMAEILVRKNRASEALAHLDRLHQRKAGNPDVAVCRARCQRLLGDSPEATRLLDETLTAHPNHVQALSERGLLALEASQLALAERLLRQAAKRDPSNSQVNTNLCRCLESLGKKEEARQVAETLRKKENEVKRMGQLIRRVMQRPHDPALRYEVGMIFLRNGFIDDGLRWLGTALQEDPQHRDTHRALAEHYENVGDEERAAPHRRFLQRTP
jgi:predicted Zn-dependent protease